jgi:hypothetical protein
MGKCQRAMQWPSWGQYVQQVDEEDQGPLCLTCALIAPWDHLGG